MARVSAPNWKETPLKYTSNVTLMTKWTPQSMYSFTTARTVGNTDCYGNDLSQMRGCPFQILRVLRSVV